VKSEKLLFYPNGKHSSFVELSLARSQAPSYCVTRERESRMVVCIARQIGTLAHHSSVALRRPSPPAQTSSTSPSSSSSSFFFTVSECFRLSSPSSASRNGLRTDKGGPRNGTAFLISRETVCHHRSFKIRTAAALSQGASAGEAMDSVKPFGVLFVCLGNICRSPSAEAVFRYLVEQKGLASDFVIDSAGTINYHEGNPADSRMRAAAMKRGVKLTSISRPIRRLDFEEFDLILAMDKQNKEDILAAYEVWNAKTSLPVDAKNKVRLMCSYCRKHDITEVPDPYYGGPAGFDKVLDLLEDACEGLLESILTTRTQVMEPAQSVLPDA
jgi:protein-tyrosine phosphatase